jgi:hypothetical protein
MHCHDKPQVMVDAIGERQNPAELIGIAIPDLDKK